MGWILSVLIGGALGAAMGYYGKCSSGTCPLTATPWRGAIYGAVMGLLVQGAMGRSGPAETAASSAHVTLVSPGQFDAELANAPGPVVVDFFATWCGPCKRLSPMLDAVAGAWTNQVKFLKVDVDQSGPVAERFGVQGVPTLVFFRNGKEVDRLVGLPAKAALEQRLSALAAPPAGP